MSDDKTKPAKIEYSHELAAELCARIAGGASLTRACADPDMPSVRAVFNWRRERPEFARMIDEARYDHADTLADEICDIADNDPDPQRARNRIEARKWRAATIKPRNYGPKMELHATLEDRTDFRALHEEAWARVVRLSGANGIAVSAPADVKLIEDAQVVEALPAPAGGDADPFS